MESNKHNARRAVKARNARKSPTRGNTEGAQVDGGEQLLPGISDDIALSEIAPRMPWKSFCALEYVSPAWLRVVRSREAHNARVRHSRPESLVLLRYAPDEDYDVLALYSTRDGLYFELPPLPLPGCERGIPNDCQCLTLDSKVYVLGGEQLDFVLVYVLDLAGRPRQWTQCASMLGHTKEYFICASLDRKIYVGRALRVTEVYDPKANTWSLIKPMPLRQREELSTPAVIEAIADRFRFGVSSLFTLRMLAAVGEELFVISDTGYFSLISRNSQRLALKFRFTADVYHPVKDEWRVETFSPRDGADSIDADDSKAILFPANGNLYRMKNCSISVLDSNTKKWMLQHHCSFAENECVHDSVTLGDAVKAITAVGDELLAMTGVECECFILQSEGFGGENLHVTWHISKRIWYDASERSSLVPLKLLSIEL